jgi:hypothetical protein
MVTHETRCSCLLGLRRAEFSPAFNSVNVVSNDPEELTKAVLEIGVQASTLTVSFSHSPLSAAAAGNTDTWAVL